MIRIQLSVKQRELLQPLFDELEANNLVGEPGAVLLQAWPDSKTGYAHAYFLYEDQANVITEIARDGLQEVEGLKIVKIPAAIDDDIPF